MKWYDNLDLWVLWCLLGKPDLEDFVQAPKSDLRVAPR